MQENDDKSRKGAVNSLVLAIGKVAKDSSVEAAKGAKSNAKMWAKSLAMDNPVSQFVRGIGSVGGGFMDKIKDNYDEYRGNEKEDADAVPIKPGSENAIPIKPGDDDSLYLQAIHESLVDLAASFLRFAEDNERMLANRDAEEKVSEKAEETREAQNEEIIRLASSQTAFFAKSDETERTQNEEVARLESQAEFFAKAEETEKTREETQNEEIIRLASSQTASFLSFAEDNKRMLANSDAEKVSEREYFRDSRGRFAKAEETRETQNEEIIRLASSQTAFFAKAEETEKTREETQNEEIIRLASSQTAFFAKAEETEKTRERTEKTQNEEVVRLASSQAAFFHREEIRRRREMEWAEKNEIEKLKTRPNFLLDEDDDDDAVKMPTEGMPDDDDKGRKKKRRGGIGMMLNPKSLLKLGVIGAGVGLAALGIKRAYDQGAFEGIGMEGALDDLKKAFFGFLDSMQPIFTAMAKIGVSLVPLLTGFLEALQPVFKALGDLFGSLVPVVSQVVDFLVPIFKMIGDTVGELIGYFTPMIEDILPVIGELFQNLIPIFEVLFTVLKPIIKILGTVLLAAFKGIVEAVNLLLLPFKWLAEGINALIDYFDWFSSKDADEAKKEELESEDKNLSSRSRSSISEEKNKIVDELVAKKKKEEGWGTWSFKTGAYKSEVESALGKNNRQFADDYKQATIEAKKEGREITIQEFIESKLADVPQRKFGGEVIKDKIYIVGEDGPELFVPESSGEVIPHMQDMEIEPEAEKAVRKTEEVTTRAYEKIATDRHWTSVLMHGIKNYDDSAVEYTRDDSPKPDTLTESVQNWLRHETPDVVFENSMVSMEPPVISNAADTMMESESFNEAVQLAAQLKESPSLSSSVVNAPSTTVMNNQRTDNSTTTYMDKGEKALSTWST